MPLYLYLLRHAQSADKQTGQTDLERTLTATGKAESTAVGKFLKEKSLFPDLILTSPAIRAKETATIIADSISHATTKIRLDEHLYEANLSYWKDLIIHLGNDLIKVMIVGHNPTISHVIDHLSGEQNRGLLPAEFVTLKFNVSRWTNTSEAKAEIVERFHPTGV
jgi:phosphohistidine phosphatase